MKKKLSIFLVLVLAITLAIPAFADDNTLGPGEGNDSKDTTVTYGVTTTYTVTIPASVSPAAPDVAGDGNTATITIGKDALIPHGQEIKVWISASENYADSKYYVVDTAASANKFEYTIQYDNGGTMTAVIPGATAPDATIILSTARSATDVTKDIYLKMVTAPTYSGTYEDKLTFNVALYTPTP